MDYSAEFKAEREADVRINENLIHHHNGFVRTHSVSLEINVNQNILEEDTLTKS